MEVWYALAVGAPSLTPDEAALIHERALVRGENRSELARATGRDRRTIDYILGLDAFKQLQRQHDDGIRSDAQRRVLNAVPMALDAVLIAMHKAKEKGDAKPALSILSAAGIKGFADAETGPALQVFIGIDPGTVTLDVSRVRHQPAVLEGETVKPV